MMKLFQSQTREIGPFNGSSEFWVTGTLSAKGKRELQARGFTVVEQVGGRIYSREPAPNPQGVASPSGGASYLSSETITIDQLRQRERLAGELRRRGLGPGRVGSALAGRGPGTNDGPFPDRGGAEVPRPAAGIEEVIAVGGRP